MGECSSTHFSRSNGVSVRETEGPTLKLRFISLAFEKWPWVKTNGTILGCSLGVRDFDLWPSQLRKAAPRQRREVPRGGLRGVQALL